MLIKIKKKFFGNFREKNFVLYKKITKNSQKISINIKEQKMF